MAVKEKKKKLSHAQNRSNILFALRQVWEVSPKYFILYFLVTFIYAPIEFLTGSFLIRLIVNGVEKSTPASTIVLYICIVAAVDLLIYAFTGYYNYIIAPAEYEKIGAHIQKKLFTKASEVELACYETPEFYDNYVRAMDEALDRVMRVMNTINNLIWRVITLVCNSFLLFAIDPVLIIFGLLPLLLGIVRRWRNKLYHDHFAAQKPIDRKIRYARRVFYLADYAKEMRVGGMYACMYEEIKAAYREYVKLLKNYGVKKAIAEFIQQFGLEVITILGAMFYAVWRTLGDGSMTIGDCIVILNSIGTVSYCLANLIQNLAEFGEHSLFLNDIRYFLDYEPKMAEDPGAPEAHGGDIEFDNVCFTYTGAEQETLHNISLKIKSGEKIALVGQNGSGKTTLIKLLLRLYDPTSGSVKLDGVDAKDYKLSSYRKNYSCVFQDFHIFAMSVKENVVLRRAEEGDDELVRAALTESGADTKVNTLEGGIDSVLTREFDEDGVNLSIGEQQKISLARVFVENSPCVVLDEPSSALDPIAEHKMFENMMRAAKGRSVIFISHRLSSAVDADRIFMLEDGSIVESGTHKELMAHGGKYAEMFSLQAANYVDTEEAVV